MCLLFLPMCGILQMQQLDTSNCIAAEAQKSSGCSRVSEQYAAHFEKPLPGGFSKGHKLELSNFMQ